MPITSFSPLWRDYSISTSTHRSWFRTKPGCNFIGVYGRMLYENSYVKHYGQPLFFYLYHVCHQVCPSQCSR